MPHAPSDGASIYYEETGQGTPIIFVHEFAGDHRSWHDQLRHFGRRWRAIAMSARGYPRSDAPRGDESYGQEFFNRDVIAVLDAAGIDKAHVVGLSMGGYAALMVAGHFPGRVLSCVAAGAGSGSEMATRDRFIDECRTTAAGFDRTGRIDAEAMGLSPTRVHLLNKDPIAWRDFVAHLAEHDAHAAASTLRRVQATRASLYEVEPLLKSIAVPTLLLVGDEDEPCLDVNLWMKRLMRQAQLAVLPGSGHAINLEEPALFNALVERFLTDVERGTWAPRDPRAVPGGVLTSLGGTEP
ncbi:MAG: alpha/beta hydrolase [Hyphomicrobiaceae bacterium]|nr:alpha/beta hydrolase [Hyphomicrobiaceae bacterium]